MDELLANINTQRTNPLTLNDALVAVCQQHSEYLARIGTLDHYGFQDRAKQAGFANVPVAENLAEADSAGDVYVMWMKSAPHRINMLNETYNLCGIGRAGRFWTLLLVKGQEDPYGPDF